MRFRPEKYLLIIDDRGLFPGGRYEGILHKRKIGIGYYFDHTYDDRNVAIFPNEKAAIAFAKKIAPSFRDAAIFAYRGDEAVKSYRSSFGGF